MKKSNAEEGQNGAKKQAGSSKKIERENCEGKHNSKSSLGNWCNPEESLGGAMSHDGSSKKISRGNTTVRQDQKRCQSSVNSEESSSNVEESLDS